MIEIHSKKITSQNLTLKRGCKYDVTQKVIA